jgi:hypothetical protein
MDRNLPDSMGYGPPQSQSYCPPTPPTFPGVPTHSLRHVDLIGKITPPEEKTPHTGEEGLEQYAAIVKENNSPYDQAFAFLQYCQNQYRRLSRNQVPSPWDEYAEKPFYIKIPITDYNRLTDYLGESDKR